MGMKLKKGSNCERDDSNQVDWCNESFPVTKADQSSNCSNRVATSDTLSNVASTSRKSWCFGKNGKANTEVKTESKNVMNYIHSCIRIHGQ